MTDQETATQLLKVAALKTPVVQVYRRNLPAAVGGVAGEVSLDAIGQYFYVKEATDPCLFQLDDGRELPFDVGTGMNTRGTGMFKKITVKNIWSHPVTVEIVVGLGEYTDNRFTLVPSRDFALPVREAYTEIDGQATTAIAANSFVELLGVPSYPRVSRKSVIISNIDIGTSLRVLDSAGHVCAAIFPLTSVTLPISNYVKIENTTAQPVTCYISEIWYVKPI